MAPFTRRLYHALCLLTSLSLLLNQTLSSFTPPAARAAVDPAPTFQTEPRFTENVPTAITTALESSSSIQLPNSPAPDPARAAAALRSSSIMFIENVGQFDPRVKFQVRGLGGTVYLTEDALWLTFLEKPSKDESPREWRPGQPPYDKPRNGVNLKLGFVAANPLARLEPFDRLDTRVSYFKGSNPTQWNADVPVWGGVRYVDLYPGLDLELLSVDGIWQPRMVVRPGVNLNIVRLRVEGADRLELKGNTQIRMVTTVNDFFWPLLRTINPDGSPFPIIGISPSITGDIVNQPFIASGTAGSSALRPGSDDLGASDPLFHSTSYRDAMGVTGMLGTSADATAAPLAFNPDSGFGGLAYSTYLGGANDESGNGIAVRTDGSIYITGFTNSTDFPTSTGAFSTTLGGGFTGADAFVTKFNADGTRAYSTYLGGGGDDGGNGIAVDTSGNAYVSGWTQWCYFPTVNAYQSTCGSSNGIDAFVAKLNSSGSQLLYSTYLGGSAEDRSLGIALDTNSKVYVTGFTYSSNFTTTSGVVYPTYRGNGDVFIAKLDMTQSGAASLTYATYLGGINSDEQANGIAVNTSGEVYVAGITNGFDTNNYPTTASAYQSTFSGFLDAFVSKLSSDGSQLQYSTLLGGNACGSDHNGANAIAVDGQGNAYITGWADIGFPVTAGAYQPINRSSNSYLGCSGWGDEVIVAKIDPTQSGTASLVYSTYLGGDGAERGYGIAVDSTGAAYVTGKTISVDFPLTAGAYDLGCGTNSQCNYDGYARASDVFVAKFNPSGNGLLYSTYLGGASNENGNSIAVDTNGLGYVTGQTYSPDFPTASGAFQAAIGYCGQTSCGGHPDAFLTALTLPNALPDMFIRNVAQPKDPREGCLVCPFLQALLLIGKPLNTRTGGEDYSTVDLSFPALGGAMMFLRSYSSLATNVFTDTLGYGWTHNHDTRLILPTSRGGMAGKSCSSPTTTTN